MLYIPFGANRYSREVLRKHDFRIVPLLLFVYDCIAQYVSCFVTFIEYIAIAVITGNVFFYFQNTRETETLIVSVPSCISHRFL